MSKINLLKLFAVFLLSTIVAFSTVSSIRFNKLVVQDQPIGSAIFIKEVRLTKPGFLAVQSLDPQTKLPDLGGFLNNPTYLPAGVYKNINLALNNAGADLQTKVTITMYEDTNGNGGFDGFYSTDAETLAPEDGFDQPAFATVGKRIIRKVIKLN